MGQLPAARQASEVKATATYVVKVRELLAALHIGTPAFSDAELSQVDDTVYIKVTSLQTWPGQ